ncbi:UreF-domain-containing protein [Peziza echinospora]|nr:UreF-domain-containing protein [Peziza echinospora]
MQNSADTGAEQLSRAELLEKIRSLETALAKTSLSTSSPASTISIPKAPSAPPQDTRLLHTLLLLSDSALPLGSFAFSSAFESYLSHHPIPGTPARLLPSEILTRFLSLSLLSLATTTLPYLIAAYEDLLAQLSLLDDTLDASTLCPVARRSSIAQGKALLSVWVKSLSTSVPLPLPAPSSSPTTTPSSSIIPLYKSSKSPSTHIHLPLAHALVAHTAGLPRETACYTYLHQHARAVVSAAVRLGVVGPYVAQRVLAGEEVRGFVWRAGEVREGGWGGAAQTVPTLDLYQGRHELLYSRVFNS